MTLDRQDLEVLRQPYLKSQDLQLDIRVVEDGCLGRGILRSQKHRENLVKLVFHSQTQTVSMVARELLRVLYHPEHKIIEISDNLQFLSHNLCQNVDFQFL